jgi:3-hydroxyacyl-[acyl-carrier-protein] dehydratase
MADGWLPVTLAPADNGAQAQVQLSPECLWFDGHFPGNPMLPGVAQLAMVEEMLRRVLPAGCCIQAIARARFKRIVRPTERLWVKAQPASDDPTQSKWNFEVSSAGELACTGVLHISPAQG